MMIIEMDITDVLKTWNATASMLKLDITYIYPWYSFFPSNPKVALYFASLKYWMERTKDTFTKSDLKLVIFSVSKRESRSKGNIPDT